MRFDIEYRHGDGETVASVLIGGRMVGALLMTNTEWAVFTSALETGAEADGHEVACRLLDVQEA